MIKPDVQIVNENKNKITKKDTPVVETKDEFGITERLKIAINIKYKIKDLIGKGSYGFVSKAVCKKSGR